MTRVKSRTIKVIGFVLAVWAVMANAATAQAGSEELLVQLKPGSERMFNPQPEPPETSLTAPAAKGSKRMFNPQPEPPETSLTAPAAKGSKRMFNPQPEPPAPSANQVLQGTTK